MVFNLSILKSRIKLDNKWRESRKIPFYKKFNRRVSFTDFYAQVKQFKLHRAVVLMGPRRVGKTVMMYQGIQNLLDDGIDAKKIFYFSLDTPIFTNIPLDELLSYALAINKTTLEGCYVFFDEIQYLKNWEVHLKNLVDANRKTKFIASGSAAATLRMKSLESGAGRFTDFFLPPLTFSEYIDLNSFDNLLKEVEVDFYGQKTIYRANDINQLNKHFCDYINFGGFPEIALSAEKIPNPEQVIQKDITDKVIMKDLPGLFGIENSLELQQFFNVLSYRTGEIMSYKNVSTETKTDIKTLKKYIEYLESAFLIKVLHRVDVTAKRFKNITQFKAYLTNPSLFTGLFGSTDMDAERFPHLVETTVFAQYLQEDYQYLRYANWKRNGREGEVDIVKISPNYQKVEWALEVKWSDSAKFDKLKFFMKKNKIAKGVLTSKTKFVDGVDLLIIPNSVYAYSVGKSAFSKI